MKRLSFAALLSYCTAASLCHAAGFAFDENFIVQAPQQALAEKILAEANEHRSRLSEKWLAQPLAAGEGRTLVHVQIAEDQLRGRFKPRQSPDDKMHTLWLACPHEQAQGAWLERYIAQVVLETRHPGQLPAWALEGISGQHDAASLVRQRGELLRWFSRTGRWPELQSLLSDDYLNTADRAALTAAPSLVELLVSRADAPTAVRFLIAGQKTGWAAALGEFYQLDGVDELQSLWQQWAAASVKDIERAPGEYAPPRYVESEHRAAGARSENFTVYAEDRQMALDLLAQAERLREEIAIEWLGEPLPPGVGRTIVSVRITEEDQANALIQDPARRLSQIMWIRTPPDRVHSALAHEIAHTVLATRFAFDLPVWAHEGIASQRDDPLRRAHVKGALAEMARSRTWPPLEALLAADALSHGDSRGYAAAASLTEFLTARGGNEKLLAFAVAGKKTGWDAALREHYGMANVRELQTAWHAWAGGAPAMGGIPAPMNRLRR